MIVSRNKLPVIFLMLCFTSCNGNKKENKSGDTNIATDSLPGKPLHADKVHPADKDSQHVSYYSVSGFWIDSSEINSNEYRQYIWPDNKDSTKN